MKLTVLAGLPILFLGGLPVMAQSSQRVDCYRDSYNYTINCPGYGSFDYRQGNQSNNQYNGNGQYNNQNNTYATVDNLYNNVLGREGDRRGLQTYRQALDRGVSLQDIRRELANSPEATQVLNNVYRQILGRDIDADGLRTYRQFLTDNGSIDQVRQQLANSPEARARRRY